MSLENLKQQIDKMRKTANNLLNGYNIFYIKLYNHTNIKSVILNQ